MAFARTFKLLLILAAALGYLADGARAHMHTSGGDTIRVMMCGPGETTKYIDIDVPGDTDEIADKCCGDCTPASPLKAEHPDVLEISTLYAPRALFSTKVSVSPRSPLWPGAPPNGPPASHLA